MYIRRRKAFFELFRLLRHIEADKADVQAVVNCNHLILQEILRAEEAVLRHREARRKSITELKTGRRDKAVARTLRTRIKRQASYLQAHKDSIFIWKSFGDAIAFLFLDRFSIKHAFFEVDTIEVKRDAGMLTGKEGLNSEIACLHAAAEQNLTAILCDITNVLRHGDVCLLGASDPVLIEVKSGERLNKRGKRQFKKLEQLQRFLSTDHAVSFRGIDGVVRRVEISAAPRDNVRALNTCIAAAKVTGQSISKPEPGVTYAAIYGQQPDYAGIFDDPGSRPKLVFMLNVAKNDHDWAPYTPFLLTIREPEHVLDFIEGRLFLIVLVEPDWICQAMADDEWMVRFRDHPDYPVQCVHRPTLAYLAMSKQFLCRAAYEFVSLAWIVEVQRPSIARLEAALERPDEPADADAQRVQLRTILGDGDPWLNELGIL